MRTSILDPICLARQSIKTAKPHAASIVMLQSRLGISVTLNIYGTTPQKRYQAGL